MEVHILLPKRNVLSTRKGEQLSDFFATTGASGADGAHDRAGVGFDAYARHRLPLQNVVPLPATAHPFSEQVLPGGKH